MCGEHGDWLDSLINESGLPFLQSFSVAGRLHQQRGDRAGGQGVGEGGGELADPIVLPVNVSRRLLGCWLLSAW